jgi:DNA-directed RNA polymerase I, II, and III subunit RPABC2
MSTKLTKYEKVKIIMQRSEQLANGAKACVETNGSTDYIKIADEEIKQGKSPIIIVRTYPNGTKQNISVIEK